MTRGRRAGARSSRSRQAAEQGESPTGAVSSPNVASMSNEALSVVLSARNVNVRRQAHQRGTLNLRSSAAWSLSYSEDSPAAIDPRIVPTPGLSSGEHGDSSTLSSPSCDSYSSANNATDQLAQARLQPAGNRPPSSRMDFLDDEASVTFVRPPRRYNLVSRLCAHVPNSVLVKARRGEFVNLNSLLKTNDSIAPPPKRFRVVDDPSDPNGCSLATQQGQASLQVAGMDSWLEA